MNNTHLILRISSIGAMVAILALIGMALMSELFGFVYLSEEILAKKIELPLTDLSRYTVSFQVYMVVDTVFVIGEMIAWMGIAALVQTRAHSLGRVVLVIGLLGASLDFVQNAVEWTLIRGQHLGISPQPSWFIVWTIISQLSYLLTYTAAVMTALGLWSKQLLDRVLGVIGGPLIVLAVVGLYVPDWYTLAFLWFFVFFLCAGILLWRRAAEWPAGALPGQEASHG
jgi:hypothetical protein